jgi:putative hydrolase of the HAD superfamily
VARDAADQVPAWQVMGGAMKIAFDFAGVLFHWRPVTMLRRELPLRTPDEATVTALRAAIFQGFGGDWAEFDRGTVQVEALIARIAASTGLRTADVRTLVEAVPRAAAATRHQ